MEAFTERCVCGRTFSQPYALTNHQRSCKKRKSRLSSALAKAKDLWTSRKRPRSNAPEAGLTVVVPAQSSTVDESSGPEVGDIRTYHFSVLTFYFVSLYMIRRMTRAAPICR